MTTETILYPKPFDSNWILGESPQKIMETVNAINAIMLTMPTYVKAFSKKNKTGAILNITDISIPEAARPLLLNPFGFVPLDGKKTYEETTMRKIDQLLDHPNHISSYQSRDGVILWGGAYPIPKFQAALSISGHPELADEAIGLGTGLELDWIDLNYAVQIAKISNNFLFKDLCPRLPSYQ